MADKNRLTFSTMTIGQYIHRLAGRSGAIRGWIEIIRDEIKSASLLADNETVQMALSDIELKAGEIILLTDEFKEYMLNTETVKSESIKTFVIQDLINQAIKEVEIGSEKVKITTYIEDVNQLVVATQSLLEVFINLLNNAVAAIPEKGEVTIKGNLSSNKQNIEIFIIDTGVGLSWNMINKIFQPYATTKLDKGHGLGLWWSKAYIESIGGILDLVSSEENKGTTFKLTIPILNKE